MERSPTAVDRPATNLPRVLLYSAIEMVKVAWAEVMATCVRNCFRKAGFVDAEPDGEPDASKEDQSGGDFWQCVVDYNMGSHDIGWNILFLLTKTPPLRNHHGQGHRS
ncbi:hypothetical protein HPB49_003435 [Dermacentor silvarum]|uniref:Uncharacterized protein n=1 Tax=Dermacentor silvarum TaxID=543639 RepID=A0ACB8CP96_DERSI|nr:hypothetical protein HPB49_003435 [Dermacentor silvarum]